jgi:outer membrane protein TolC
MKLSLIGCTSLLLAIATSISAEDTVVPAPAVTVPAAVAEPLVAPVAAAPVAAAPVAAAPVAAAPTLTLDEALVEAATHAPTPAIAQARLERVRALQTQARALLMPTVTLGGSYGSQWTNRQPYAGRSTEILAGQADVAIRLFDGTAFPAMKSAKNQFAGQEHASRDLRRASAFSVATSYLTVITAERLKVVATRRLDVANQLLEEARARLKAGLAIASDVTRAEVEVADSNLSLSQAVQAIELGRLALQEAMGGREPGVLAEPLVTAPEDQKPDDLLVIARRQRDDLAAARFAVESNLNDAEVIRRGNWPVLGAHAGVADQDRNDGTNGLYGDTHYVAGLTASWSLYDGGLRSGRVEETEAAGRERRLNVRAIELGAQREVRTAVVQITTAVAGVAQAEARSRSAAADAADAFARYRAGTGTATELADAQYRSASADADLTRRKIEVLSFRLGLRQALGSWPLSDVEPTGSP